MLQPSASVPVSPVVLSFYPKFWFDKVPEPGRFATAGLLGNFVFFLIDYALYNSILLPLSKSNNYHLPKLIQRNKETVSFFISYLIQTSAQHFLNALLVYGLETIDSKKKYWDTLIITYSSYSVSLIGSTIGNALLIKQGVPRNIAFWGTILSFGVVNFFLLKYLVGGNDGAARVDESTCSSNTNQTAKRAKVIGTKRGGHQQINTISQYFDEERERIADPMLLLRVMLMKSFSVHRFSKDIGF